MINIILKNTRGRGKLSFLSSTFPSSLSSSSLTSFSYFSSDSNKERTNCCWKCGCILPSTSSHHCSNKHCNILQPVSPKKNLFSLFSITPKYDISLSALESAYKNLQKVFHPDKYATEANELREISKEASMIINKSYDILKDPISRAEYMAKIYLDTDLFDEGKQNKNQELMMEMFEWHERLSDIDEKDQESLKVLNEEISKNLQKSTEEFSKYLESKDKIKATEAGIKMKFFSKILDEIKEKLEVH